MRVGEIDKITIKINCCFFIIAGLFILAGMIKEVMVVFFSVFFHEAAHVVMARCCGYKISEIELLPFGGVARIERFWECDKNKIFLVAVSGPLFSLFLACLCLGAASLVEMDFLRLIGQVNMVLGCFNLLPAFPLDGGHIFRVAFMIFFSYQQSTRYLAVLSGMVSAALLGKLLYDFIFYQFANVSLVVMILFILIATRREVKGSGFHAVKIMAYKKVDLFNQGYMETMHYTVEKSIKMKVLTKLFVAGKYTVIIVVDEEYRICGTFTEIEVWEAIAARGIDASFADILA